MHQHPSCCFAIDPAMNQRPGYHCQRYLNALEIGEKIAHLAFRLAPATHLRYRFGQHNPPLQVPAKGRRLLRGVRMAYRRALFCRGLALLAIPAEQLAPPVIAVPSLRHSGWRWITASVSLLNQLCFLRFPRSRAMSAISGDLGPCFRAAHPLPHGLNYDSKRLIPFDPGISPQIGSQSRRTGLKSRQKCLFHRLTDSVPGGLLLGSAKG
jgi:hypothetical protein